MIIHNNTIGRQTFVKSNPSRSSSSSALGHMAASLHAHFAALFGPSGAATLLATVTREVPCSALSLHVQDCEHSSLSP